MATFKSVVLIDDDIDDQDIFIEAVKQVDKTVELVIFDNGEQALQSLQGMACIPNLMFLDLNMPRMNGIEFLTMMQNDTQLRRIPVVVYTTYFDQTVEKKCFDLGALNVMQKPNSFELLCARIDELLKNLEK